jgi:hypothetical protein
LKDYTSTSMVAFLPETLVLTICEVSPFLKSSPM